MSAEELAQLKANHGEGKPCAGMCLESKAVATIEALQRERDFLSCLVAEWESAAMRSLLAYIEDIKPSKAILEERAQTSKAIREAVEDHPWIKVAAKRYREYQPGEAGHHQRRAALEMKS